MIHKFILGRCVQCNLLQEDLENFGWECHGHDKSVSAPAHSNNLDSSESSDPKLIQNGSGHAQASMSAPTSQYADDCDCPKCAATIRKIALICPHCSFDVAGYRENLRETKHTEMAPMPITRETKAAALATVYRRGSGCAGWAMMLISCVIWIIPIIGWIAAPIFFIMGLVSIVSPVTGSQFLYSIFEPEEYRKQEAEASQLLQNSFENVICPICHHVEDEIVWNSPGGHLNCRQCAKPLLRQGNRLYYIPNPDALLSDNLKLFPSRLVGSPPCEEKTVPLGEKEKEPTYEDESGTRQKWIAPTLIFIFCATVILAIGLHRYFESQAKIDNTRAEITNTRLADEQLNAMRKYESDKDCAEFEQWVRVWLKNNPGTEPLLLYDSLRRDGYSYHHNSDGTIDLWRHDLPIPDK